MRKKEVVGLGKIEVVSKLNTLIYEAATVLKGGHLLFLPHSQIQKTFGSKQNSKAHFYKSFVVLVLFLTIASFSFAQSCGDGICSQEKDCYADCSDELPKPSNIFGQIIDEEGTPVYNELVSARWIDAFGNNQSASAKTMTDDEAESFGNKKLEGFFLFTDGLIRADPNTMIEIRTQPRYTFLLVKPEEGRTQDIGSIKVFGVIPNQQGQENIRESSVSLKEIAQLFFGWLWNHLLYAFLAVILLIGLYAFNRERQRRKRIKSVTDLALYRAMRDFIPSTVGDVMQKNLVCVQEHEGAKEAIRKILQTHHGSILVMREDAVLGILSETHLVKVFNALDEQSSAFQCMEPLRISATPNTSLLEALRLMVQHKTRKLPVMKNGITVGLVSMTDITKVLNAHFPQKITDSKLPQIHGLYNTDLVRIEKDAPLQSIVTLMTNALSEYCLVYEYADDQKKAIRMIGIITANDVLKELNANSDHQKVKAQSIMSSPIISMNPRLNSLEAIKILCEKNVRIVPIIELERIVGVLTEEMVMAALYHYLSQTNKKIEEFRKLIK